MFGLTKLRMELNIVPINAETYPILEDLNRLIRKFLQILDIFELGLIINTFLNIVISCRNISEENFFLMKLFIIKTISRTITE